MSLVDHFHSCLSTAENAVIEADATPFPSGQTGMATQVFQGKKFVEVTPSAGIEFDFEDVLRLIHALEAGALISRQPELKAAFERLQGDTRLAREVLPLVNATEGGGPELPAYARERLQTKVRQTLGRPPAAVAEAGETNRRMMWRWSWVLGLATAAAAVALIVVPLVQRGPAPVVQVAMLDTAGSTRGSDAGELALLRQAWSGATVTSLPSSDSARAWQTNWPADSAGATVKILYDKPAGELKVLGRWKGTPLEKAFVVDQDLAAALNRAKAYIREQTKR